MVDELGPLELERGLGRANALEVLHAGRFTQRTAVVHPTLLDAFTRAVKGVPFQVFALLRTPGVELSWAVLRGPRNSSSRSKAAKTMPCS